MGNAELIKTVRGLDQTGVGENGEHLELLWRNLTATADSDFHAAEESSLRWLLKSMNGSSEAAETLRRAPLAWNVLSFVFRRIPLFSLAKSLADRKFIVVIQQALKEVSTPALAGSKQITNKRKLSPSVSYGLDSCRTAEGCVASGQAIFGALSVLLRRLEESEESSAHHRIGAEHLRSLFSLPPAEAISLVAPALSICGFSIQYPVSDDAEGREAWIAVVSGLWALHLQSSDDLTEFATHLFGPVARVWDGLRNIADVQDGADSSCLRRRWSENLETFVHRNFILPVRSAFLSRQDIESVDLALKTTGEILDYSCPALFFFSCTAVEQLAEQGVRKGNAEWIQKLFQVCEGFLREREDGSKIMLAILQQARDKNMPLKVEDLRAACRRYALRDDLTDWAMVAHVAQCDPDVFQIAEDGQKLLEEVCQRTLDKKLSDSDAVAVSEVIDAIIRGFRTGRSFPAFLKLWFQQLSKLEDWKSKHHSPWYTVGREGRLAAFDYSSIEGTMSPQQLFDVVEWVGTQETCPKALYLWLSVVSQGIVSENFKDFIAERLLHLSMDVKKTSSDLTALKWRVVSRVMGWVAAEQRASAWNEIQKDLKKILKKSPLESAETYEAFKCCCRLWVAMSPDDPQADEVAGLVEAFTSRLIPEVASYTGTWSLENPDNSSTYMETELCPDTAIQQYIQWYLRGSTRLNRLYHKKHGSLLPTLKPLVTSSEPNASNIECAWRSLVENEHTINHAQLASNLVDQAVKGFLQSKREKKWPGESGHAWLRVLSSFPLDVVSRSQREAVMAGLVEGSGGGVGLGETSPEGFKAILSLATKLMARPTYYKDMAFLDLVNAADAASRSFVAAKSGSEDLLEIVERYSDFASSTIRQMADDPERCNAYFAEGQSFASHATESSKPLRMTLLKTMIRGLSGSQNCLKDPSLVSLVQACRASLWQSIARVLEDWASDKKIFSKSDQEADLRLFAAMDGAMVTGNVPDGVEVDSSGFQALIKRSQAAMDSGDLRGWKLQIFLQRQQFTKSEGEAPAAFPSLESIPHRIRESLLRDYVESIVEGMQEDTLLQYLQLLIEAYAGGVDTDGQLAAIYYLTDQLIGHQATRGVDGPYDLSSAHAELTSSLSTATTMTNAIYLCRILFNLTEKLPERGPNAMSQWNIDSLLSCVSVAAASSREGTSVMPYVWMCKLVEATIKKRRLRLEDHYHILLNAIQSLLRNLVLEQQTATSTDGLSQESKAHAFSRLITLICEPTAGAVARSQQNSTLDSAVDAAKRTAGRQMYLVLMQYVKLQLETDVSRGLREALEPAMNAIFDVTPPEGRKLLNDGMDASGRAILREMFKRYTRFGKWSGV